MGYVYRLFLIVFNILYACFLHFGSQLGSWTKWWTLTYIFSQSTKMYYFHILRNQNYLKEELLRNFESSVITSDLDLDSLTDHKLIMTVPFFRNNNCSLYISHTYWFLTSSKLAIETDRNRLLLFNYYCISTSHFCPLSTSLSQKLYIWTTSISCTFCTTLYLSGLQETFLYFPSV